jgi:hypothetical protein
MSWALVIYIRFFIPLWLMYDIFWFQSTTKLCQFSHAIYSKLYEIFLCWATGHCIRSDLPSSINNQVESLKKSPPMYSLLRMHVWCGWSKELVDVLHRAFPDTPQWCGQIPSRWNMCSWNKVPEESCSYRYSDMCIFAEMTAVYSGGVEMYISYSHIVLPFTSGTTHRSV